MLPAIFIKSVYQTHKERKMIRIKSTPWPGIELKHHPKIWPYLREGTIILYYNLQSRQLNNFIYHMQHDYTIMAALWHQTSKHDVEQAFFGRLLAEFVEQSNIDLIFLASREGVCRSKWWKACSWLAIVQWMWLLTSRCCVTWWSITWTRNIGCHVSWIIKRWRRRITQGVRRN